jgi:anthranilate/para-aminobenzoate synthase component I
MLSARLVDVPADPLQIGRSLADRPGFAMAWDGRPGGTSFIACEPEAESAELDPELDIPTQLPSGLAHAPRWFGLLPYESCREVERSGNPPATDRRPNPHIEQPLWLRYGAVVEVRPGSVRVIGDDAEQVRRLVAAIERRAITCGDATLALAAPPEAEALHEDRIRAALMLIAKGELYQVNLARLFRLQVAGHPLAHLARQGARTRAAYGYALHTADLGVVSTSPELFLRTHSDGRIITSPIKGTRPRGQNAVEDAALVSELEADEKEHAELTMVVDVERNDLGRICKAGSIRLAKAYATQTLPTLHHRVADVVGLLRPGVTRRDVLHAMLPSGSVTGAPKIRAMEVIAELESARRGLYTGAFGVLRHDGCLELGMAIRTLTVRAGEAHYYAGGGIVADSDPRREVAETLWKARQISEAAQNWPA